MAITFQSGNDKNLYYAIVEALQECTVNYNFLLNLDEGKFEKMKDLGITPKSTEILYEHLGEDPIHNFIIGFISDKIHSNYVIDIESDKKPLKEFPEFSDTLSVSRSIQAELLKVPSKHRISVLLPSEFSSALTSEIEDIKISENYRICTGRQLKSDFLTKKHESTLKLINHLQNTSTENGQKSPAEPLDDRLYFCVEKNGYTTQNISPILYQSLMDDLRALYGSLFAKNAISRIYSTDNEAEPYIFVHEIENGMELRRVSRLSSDLWKSAKTMSLASLVKTEKSKDSFKSLMNSVKYIFSEENFARKMHTSAIWYHRSITSNEPLDKILYATIAMEVLLGDKETSHSVGITRLLSNRCAFLLGTSRSERDEIINKFEKIYQLRSRIVHAGKHKVSKDDRNTVDDCLSLCGRIISRELELHTN